MSFEPLRPRTSLARLLATLGDNLLQVLSSPPAPRIDIFDVAIYDPMDEAILSEGDLVLGVGLHDGSPISDILEEIGRCGAAGLVLKLPVTADSGMRRAVNRSGVAVLGLTRAASWTQVALLVRASLAPIGAIGSLGNGNAPPDDLFGLADAVSTLLDAPVTIEDRLSRILAFSCRQDEADAARLETVLSRQVPEKYRQMLEDKGVFEQLTKSGQPVFIEALSDGMLPRVAVSLHAGEEILGSMWVAVPGPLTEERSRAFIEAAKVVALHLLTVRAGADVAGRLRTDLIATLLEGDEEATSAAHRLGLGNDRLCVVAAQPLIAGGTSLETARHRLTSALRVHLAAVYPRSAVALIDGTTYGVVTLDRRGRNDDRSVARIADLPRTNRRSRRCCDRSGPSR